MADLLPAVAAATTSTIVGSTIVATRFVIGEITPASLALLRYSIGLSCLLPVVLVSVHIRFDRRDLLPVCALGIVQFGVLTFLLNYALQFIPSGRAALIFATMPLMTILLAAIFGYETLTAVKTLGVLLTVAGVGFALGEQAFQAGGTTFDWVGDLAVFASAFSGAICAILYRPFLRKYPTLQISAFTMLAAVGFLALLSAREGVFRALPRLTMGDWLVVGFIGVSSGVGYYLWLWALDHSTPTKVTVFLSLSPISAAGLGALLLSERVSTTFIVGLVCVAFGLWLAHR